MSERRPHPNPLLKGEGACSPSSQEGVRGRSLIPHTSSLIPSRLLALAALAIALALAGWAATRPPRWQIVAAYRTGLDGRTDAQVHNLRLAVKSISGRTLQPGAEFSFNRVVGSWSADRGYVKAPVSYDGELIPSYGGGVCQASTTLYNAALLAGMKIQERHRHRFPVRYAPPGQDAAVAQTDIDLRFRNPYAWPLKIEATVEGNGVVCRVLSQQPLGRDVSIHREVRQVTPPGEVMRVRDSDARGLRWRLVNPGAPGMQVAVYRRTTTGARSARELISEDTYPPMNRLLWGESRRL